MSTLDQFREALGSRIGQVLTPELCAAIEVATFSQPDRSLAPAQFGTARCGSLTFQTERFDSCLPELHILHQQHWLETEKHRHGLAMNPDYGAMLADERAGQMIQFTARAGGQLVGNLRMYIRTGRHTQTQHAVEDTLYLAPEHRAGRNAIRFIEFVHDSMRTIGVLEIRADAKLVNGTDRLLKFMGYLPVATQFVKFLE